MCHADVRACHLQYLLLRWAKRNRQLKGMVHFFPLTVKGVHDDDPSCKRLHSIKLREMYSVPVPKSFGGFKHLTPLLNIQKWFHVVFFGGFLFLFLCWKHFFSGKFRLSFLTCFKKTRATRHLRLKQWIIVYYLTKLIDQLFIYLFIKVFNTTKCCNAISSVISAVTSGGHKAGSPSHKSECTVLTWTVFRWVQLITSLHITVLLKEWSSLMAAFIACCCWNKWVAQHFASIRVIIEALSSHTILLSFWRIPLQTGIPGLLPALHRASVLCAPAVPSPGGHFCVRVCDKRHVALFSKSRETCRVVWVPTDPSFSRLQEVHQSCFKWSHAPAAADLEIVNECCSQRYLLVAIWLCREKLSSWSILHTFPLYLQPLLGWRVANKSCSEASAEQLGVRENFFSFFFLTHPIVENFLSSEPM